MTEQLLLQKQVDGTLYLTLNNPDRRNSLSSHLLTELNDSLDRIQDDSTVRVIVIRSEGPAFSSGHDLNELVNRDAESYASLFTACTSVMEAIRLSPKPVIAEVQGLATAAGCQLVATCDLAIASDTALFATPGVQIGLFCTTPGVAVSRAVRTKKAMEMLLTGIPITANEAVEYGLINRAVPADKLKSEVEALARTISNASAYTVALGKSAFYQQKEMDIPAAYEMAEKIMVENLLAADAHEGITAFLEKRTPHWTT
ncbi:MAG: enoyl-CoA hydratase [Chloroflexi bacterium]|jgi:enoyl-CoA hydratase/carnithine racemase|nr:enoyl-CoA hydratase [Chloroflexota bacterium]MDP6497714.1 enoyl-CoA hydratase [Dehalococcoidia bacterium]MQG55387.1 enoyl-CoA hydratase [SAR202 cluster bacterium]